MRADIQSLKQAEFISAIEHYYNFLCEDFHSTSFHTSSVNRVRPIFTLISSVYIITCSFLDRLETALQFISLFGN